MGRHVAHPSAVDVVSLGQPMVGGLHEAEPVRGLAHHLHHQQRVAGVGIPPPRIQNPVHRLGIGQARVRDDVIQGEGVTDLVVGEDVVLHDRISRQLNVQADEGGNVGKDRPGLGFVGHGVGLPRRQGHMPVWIGTGHRNTRIPP